LGRTSFYGQEGREEAGLEMFQLAVKLAPGVSRYHFALSDAVRWFSRNDEAIKSAEKALEINPENSLATDQLSEISQIGDSAEAIAENFKPSLEEILDFFQPNIPDNKLNNTIKAYCPKHVRHA